MISVVAPVFRNAATLEELAARVRRVAEGLAVDHELLLVDDASPDAAADVIAGLVATDPAVGGLLLARNVGQHRAVLAGLAVTRGDRVVVLDADLQDPPETIPDLLARADQGYEVVFAGRHGRYQAWHRMVTSRLYKTVQHLLTGVPRDASMFMLLSRHVATRQLPLPGGEDLSVVVQVGLAGVPCASVPVRRDRRPAGGSAYPSWRRWQIGARNAAGAVAWRWWPGKRPAGRLAPVRVARRLGVCASAREGHGC